MSTSIYMDESGDLGWSFVHPYQNRGSSRYLTIAAVIVPTAKAHILARIIRGFYKNRNRNIKNELKSVEMRASEKEHFVNQLLSLHQTHKDIKFVAITVYKQNVNDAFRKHPNGLYNYVTKLLLLHEMKNYRTVEFIPDARSVKTNLQHCLEDYLKLELATLNSSTCLSTIPHESKDCLQIQFADILSSIVWASHEFNAPLFNKIKSVVVHKNLFFPSTKPHTNPVTYRAITV